MTRGVQIIRDGQVIYDFCSKDGGVVTGMVGKDSLGLGIVFLKGTIIKPGREHVFERAAKLWGLNKKAFPGVYTIAEGEAFLLALYTRYMDFSESGVTAELYSV